MVNGFLSLIQRKLLTGDVSVGEDVFVDEEVQDHDICHAFYIGSIYTWLIMLIRIYGDLDRVA